LSSLDSLDVKECARGNSRRRVANLGTGWHDEAAPRRRCAPDSVPGPHWGLPHMRGADRGYGSPGLHMLVRFPSCEVSRSSLHRDGHTTTYLSLIENTSTWRQAALGGWSAQPSALADEREGSHANGQVSGPFDNWSPKTGYHATNYVRPRREPLPPERDIRALDHHFVSLVTGPIEEHFHGRRPKRRVPSWADHDFL
jgi:hypothetical protein